MLTDELQKKRFPQPVVRKVGDDGDVGLEDVDQQQVVEQRPRSEDDPLGDGPVVIPFFSRLRQQRFGQIHGATTTTDMHRLVAAKIPKIGEVAGPRQRDADRQIEQRLAEAIGNLFENLPELEDKRFARVKLGEALVVRGIG